MGRVRLALPNSRLVVMLAATDGGAERDLSPTTLSLPMSVRWAVVKKPALLKRLAVRLVKAVWRLQRATARRLGGEARLHAPVARAPATLPARNRSAGTSPLTNHSLISGRRAPGRCPRWLRRPPGR